MRPDLGWGVSRVSLLPLWGGVMKDHDYQAAFRRVSLIFPLKVEMKDSGNEAEKGYPFLNRLVFMLRLKFSINYN